MSDSIISTDVNVDHNKEIPAAERSHRATGGERIYSADYIMALLCKQDKEQLDRIERKLGYINQMLLEISRNP